MRGRVALETQIVSLLGFHRQLAEQQDLQPLLGLIAEHALRLTGGERGCLLLEEQGELRLGAAPDSGGGRLAPPELGTPGSAAREALRRMQPVRVGYAVDGPGSSAAGLPESRSILCVPFEISGELRGAIYVERQLHQGDFDERAERLCQLLSDQGALAILHVKRMEEMRSQRSELERRMAAKEADLQDALRALREGSVAAAGVLIGRSPALCRVREILARAAPSDLAVLITGESGTGKELAARALHEQSARRKGPFLLENCGALPAELVESTLFGRPEGPLPGAEKHRAGLLEQCAGGTLFLEEIGALPLELQARFLLALESGEVRRVGDDTPRRVDFRLVATSQRDLEREVREGRFLQDLYFRVAGLEIRMPALAERTEDIELLVEHFLRLDEAAGRPRRRIGPRVLAALARRAWPGNVRELRNEVARLCILSEGDVEDPALVSPPARLGLELGIKEIVPISELERQAIQDALHRTGGDKRRAAELLGISRAKIYQRLKDWGKEAR